MTTRVRVALLLITVLLCFGLGLFSVLLDQPLSQSPADPEALQNQRVALVIGIDRFDATTPELLALWQIVYSPLNEDLFLLGIPLDARLANDPQETLLQRFALAGDGGPTSSFLEGFDGGQYFRPDAIVVLDETGFSALIDYMGGIDIRGAELQGDQVIEIMRALRNDPQNSLALQKEVLSSLTAHIPVLQGNPDFTPLVALLPEHGYLSLPPFRLMTLFSPALSLPVDRIYVVALGP